MDCFVMHGKKDDFSYNQIYWKKILFGTKVDVFFGY